ncbi:MAG: NAD(P)-binding domain-containing protein [Chloroflexota bacterium]
MKITIFGSGNIGATIGKKWAEAGHQITFAVRNVADPKYQILQETVASDVIIAAIPESVDTADVILFAIPGTAIADTMAALDGTLDGKIIIDATNKVQAAVMNSLADIAAQAPQAKLFRAFNSLGWENFETPHLGETQIDLFYCGDIGNAQETVHQLIADIGLRPIYVGDREQAGTVDNLTKLWFTLAFGQGYGRRLAFKLVSE